MAQNGPLRTGVVILALAVAVPALSDYEAGQRVWDAGQQNAAIAEWQRSAAAGDAQSMLALGRLYVRGEGVLQDYVQAYKWFNLAASRGEGTAVAEREALTAQMSLEERAEARKLALEWQPGRSTVPPSVGQEDITSAGIREAQTILATLGYRPGPADGQWGQRTTSALQAFLRDSGLPPPDTLTDALRILRSASQQTAQTQDAPHLLKPLQVKAPQAEPPTAEPPQADSPPFTIIAQPWEAQVRIVNIDEPYAVGMALDPGEYEVEVSAPGYETKRETVRHGPAATLHQTALVKAEPRRQAGEHFRDCPVCPEVVVVPAGSFLMGSAASEEGHDASESPQREVTISQPFAVGIYEVTFAEWDACVRDGGCNRYRPNDAGWGRGRQPVINVNWADAQAYVRWLAEESGRSYRLPSEAEWEYVARAGTQTPFHFGQTITPTQANYNATYIYAGGWQAADRRRTLPVGNFSPNAFGLYDVHGNAWEWTQDCWNPDHSKAPQDGRARTTGDCSRRIPRGGSWIFSPIVLRSACRTRYAADYRYSHVGFRVIRTLPYLTPPGIDGTDRQPERATSPGGAPADRMAAGRRQ